MTEPELSVVLCTYNRGEKLGSVLNDFANQVFPEGRFQWELVLVDNNSNDGTKELVQQYKKDTNLPIRYIFESQQGKSFALNSGIKNSGGDLLAFTDDDVILDAKWLFSIYSAFRIYPENNCFGGKVLPIIDGSLPKWLSGEDKKYQIHGGPIVTHDRGDQSKEYDETMYVPIGSNMFIRKKIFRKHGYFNTKLGFYSREALVYGEDSELMFRFKYGGERIIYYPHALVYHPAPSERIKKSYFRRWYWGVARGRVRWPDIGAGGKRYCNIPRYLIRELIEEIFRWVVSLPGRKEYKKFYHEMQVLYKLGMIYEYYINGD